VIITTPKIYKKNFDKKDTRPKYAAFPEGAYKFSRAKIIVKKKA
jgi:hypothetical protein